MEHTMTTTTIDRWRQRRLLGGWALLPLRLVIGLGFLVHGMAKWSRGPAAFGRLLEYLGEGAVCEEPGGGVYLAAGTFADFAGEHLEWSLRNLAFAREVGTAEKARDYVRSHR